MYKIGMYGGSFNPLHLGHVNDIIIASNLCEKVYISLCVSKANEISHKERFKWLKNITADMENVEVFEVFDNSLTKEDYDWEEGASYIKNYIGKPIDVVFSGDDYKGKNIWETLYPESEVWYIPRIFGISSTLIRSNPYKYFEYLPDCVKPYYVKKVCIIGTESCGKSTLVRNLAKYYNTAYVEEVGREICDKAGGIDNMQSHHYFEILFEHKRLEAEMLEKANKVLLIDTDSLVTLYYYKLSFEETEEYDESIEKLATEISKLNKYDLYIFLEPDVEWVQDGTRTYREEREKNNIILKNILDKNGISYVPISGDYNDRYEKSKKLIDELLESDQ